MGSAYVQQHRIASLETPIPSPTTQNQRRPEVGGERVVEGDEKPRGAGVGKDLNGPILAPMRLRCSIPTFSVQHRPGLSSIGAIEFGGPSHFATGTLEPLGHTRLRDRLLSAMGWHVVSIPFFDWDGLHQPEQMDAYVKHRLLQHPPTASAQET